jgi:hypothetical protein
VIPPLPELASVSAIWPSIRTVIIPFDLAGAQQLIIYYFRHKDFLSGYHPEFSTVHGSLTV